MYRNIGDETARVTKLIEPAVSNAVKALTAGYNAEDLVEHRNEILDRPAIATPYDGR